MILNRVRKCAPYRQAVALVLVTMATVVYGCGSSGRAARAGTVERLGERSFSSRRTITDTKARARPRRKSPSLARKKTSCSMTQRLRVTVSKFFLSVFAVAG